MGEVSSGGEVFSAVGTLTVPTCFRLPSLGVEGRSCSVPPSFCPSSLAGEEASEAAFPTLPPFFALDFPRTVSLRSCSQNVGRAIRSAGRCASEKGLAGAARAGEPGWTRFGRVSGVPVLASKRTEGRDGNSNSSRCITRLVAGVGCHVGDPDTGRLTCLPCGFGADRGGGRGSLRRLLLTRALPC